MSDLIIKAENITKIYKLYDKPIHRMKESLHPFGKKYHHEHYALKNVSFEVKTGETVGIIGANGAGKSTLLKIITGVLTQSSGNLVVNGRISSLLELGAGLNPEVTGYDNIYFMGTIMGFTKNEIDQKVEEIVAFADIGKYIYQPVKTYSTGMMARLGFGVAVHVEPDVLIIDEALSVGDIRFQQRAIRKMQSMMDKAKAILFVSHSMDTIRKMCKRCIWMNNGEIVEDGVSKKVTKNYYDFMTIGQISVNRKKDNVKEREKNNVKESNIEFDDISGCESIGDRRASIDGVALYDKDCNKVNQLEGGENVTLYLKIKIFDDIENPSIGMHIKNYLGMNIFGVSTSSFQYNIDPLLKNDTMLFKMKFTIPKLINGDYTITVFISDYLDSQNKTKIHVVYDALLIKILSTDIKQKHSSLIIPENAEFSIL